MGEWTEIAAEIMAETDSAIKVRVVDGADGVWLPRAHIEIGERACGLQMIGAPAWLLTDTGLV